MRYVIAPGDCLSVLKTLSDGTVQCCVTSPPYWGLRDYGTAQWEGGDSDCRHFKLAGGTGAQNLGKSAAASAANVERASVSFRDVCGKCGARRIDDQLGLERTPDEYVAKMVQVFREVRRVLRDDGTLWLNLGDSYANVPAAAGGQGKQWTNHGTVQMRGISKPVPLGLKPKDLVGIPWPVAFGLQADGWYLPRDIIWAKPNPMPESVTDRPTKAHEYLFLLAKSESYYYDADAVRERASTEGIPQTFARPCRDARAFGKPSGSELHSSRIHIASGRNRRTVWTVTTRPFKGAHFATMPPKLVEPCILAGSRPHDIVLDPFNGAATVGLVALHHDRRYLGIELNPEYIDMSHKRLRGETIEPASLTVKKAVPQPLPLSYIFGQVKHGRRRAA